MLWHVNCFCRVYCFYQNLGYYKHVDMIECYNNKLLMKSIELNYVK